MECFRPHSEEKEAEAEALYRQAMLMQNLLRNDHPSLAEQGKVEEAETHHRRAFDNAKRRLGWQHPETTACAQSLSQFLTSCGRCTEALKSIRGGQDLSCCGLRGKAALLELQADQLGRLHVGGARTALFNWLFAKSQGGEMILRVEERPDILLLSTRLLLRCGASVVIWNSDDLGGDFVIVRQNGMPMYNFGVVVDDAFMGITHVLRAQAAMNADRTKLSKRHGAVSVGEYQNRGYLASGMVNYLAQLGWNDGTKQEIYTIEELLDAFKMDRMSKVAAIFDADKFKWVNGHHVRRLSDEEVAQYSTAYTEEMMKKEVAQPYIEDGSIKETAELLLEAQAGSSRLVSNRKAEMLMNKTDLATQEELSTTEEVLQALNPDAELIRCTYGKASPIELLPEIPHGLKYPEFGRGKNFRWAQNPQVLQIRVKAGAATKSKDINFDIGRTWVQIWVKGESVPRLQGKLFGRLKGLLRQMGEDPETFGRGESPHVEGLGIKGFGWSCQIRQET
eukprot:Skav228015  [mRNA]  locus=scaffold1073:93991:117343:+ [translate_table: standard]